MLRPDSVMKSICGKKFCGGGGSSERGEKDLVKAGYFLGKKKGGVDLKTFCALTLGVKASLQELLISFGSPFFPVSGAGEGQPIGRGGGNFRGFSGGLPRGRKGFGGEDLCSNV